MKTQMMEDPESPSSPPPPPPFPTSPRKRGGWKAIAFILGNESFEKLASMSLIANITVYLRTKYNLEGVFLVNVVNIWSGCSNFTTLVGAFLSDAYIGKFLTLLFGSVFSLLGMGMMTLSAGITNLRPPACETDSNCVQPRSWQLGFLFAALSLLAIGSGGIRPCNIAFGADQFDTRTEKGRSQLKSFFDWWYFSFTVALIFALTIVVYIQTSVSWVLGFAIPTGCFIISIIIFLHGRHLYVYVTPRGSVFVDIFKVINASWRKRKLPITLDSKFYDPPTLKSDQQSGIFARTNRLKCIDKAALILDPSELNSEGLASNEWRLCTIQQVEVLKCLVGIIPVWFTAIACFVVMDQMNTFGILQVIQSNTIVRNFKVPPGWIGLTSMLTLAFWIFVFECVYIPCAKKINPGKDYARLSTKQRIRIGIIMSIVCMVVAGFVERRRRELALQHHSFTSPLSFAALLPQFMLSGLLEAFAAVAIMEFFNNQVPESMRSVAGSIFFLSLSIASYLNTVLVNLVHSLSKRNGRAPWLGGHDLNANRLDYFYFLVAGFAAINFCYYNFFSSRFVFEGRRNDVASDSSIKSKS
ncbi:hypothetical protein NMG60_11004331 [Bertholletia excelsa]